jgi:HSP20 family molecular chaperone IbpA
MFSRAAFRALSTRQANTVMAVVRPRQRGFPVAAAAYSLSPPVRSLGMVPLPRYSPTVMPTDFDMLFPTHYFGATDVSTLKDGTMQFDVDTPGLTKSDIAVSVSPDNVLTIQGEHTTVQSESESEGGESEAAADANPDSPVGSIDSHIDDSVDDTSGTVRSRWSERSHLSFVRSFQLPATAQLSKITAKVDNGVLQVLVPTHKPRTIAVVDGSEEV